MKSKNIFLSLGVVCFFTILSFAFFSCKKTDEGGGDTPITHDTLHVHDTVVGSCDKDTTVLLTSNKWQIKEIRSLVGSQYQYYLRGGSGNNINYDNTWIKFEANGTGNHHDDNNNTWPFTWSFVNGDKTKVRVTINYGSYIQVLNYDNLYVKPGKLTYTNWYLDNNPNNFNAKSVHIIVCQPAP